MNSPDIEIYTTPWCPYCHAARALLEDRDASFREVDVSDPDRLDDMIRRAHGRRTVPQVFIGGRHIGGYADLLALDREGRLDGLLRGEAA